MPLLAVHLNCLGLSCPRSPLFFHFFMSVGKRSLKTHELIYKEWWYNKLIVTSAYLGTPENLFRHCLLRIYKMRTSAWPLDIGWLWDIQVKILFKVTCTIPLTITTNFQSKDEIVTTVSPPPTSISVADLSLFVETFAVSIAFETVVCSGESLSVK